MSAALVSLERRPDGVAVVRIDRPKVNALSFALLAELGEAAQSLIDDPPGAVVLTGGPRVFAAGFEVAELRADDGDGEGDGVTLTPERAREISGAFRDVVGAVAAIPRFTIAAVCGVALGGGLELALACDWRIAAADARLGLPEVWLGILPGGGGTQRLPRLIGATRAKELILTGRQIDAGEALAIGLVDQVVAPDQVHDVAVAKAAELAGGAVVAQGLAKRAVDEGVETTLAWGLDAEADRFAEVFATDDARAGVESFLRDGPGQARFTGH